MNKAIIFEHVSKQYKLGVSRTSLPSLASYWTRRLLKSGGASSPVTDILLALNDVSFDLDQGNSLALVGSNGAGKTTILKLLANITKPNTGKIQVNGKLSALIELGAGFHPDLSGRENIFLNGTILGLSRKEIGRRLDEIIDFSELERFIDTPVKRYSSGMIVRLGFAVASCIQPDILLVDEVLAVGDATFRQKCLSRIQSLLSGGTSILFVSHNLYMVQAVCQKALYLKKGQVQLQGETKNVIEAYERDLHADRARKFTSEKVDKDTPDSSLEITNVEIVDPENPRAETLHSRREAQIRVHYNAYRDLGKLNMSIFAIRSDGMTCFMLRTHLDDVSLDISRGVGTVTVNVAPLQLVGGTYYLTAWFLDEADSMEMVSVAGRSDWFSVQGVSRSYESSSGIYEPNTRWSHSHDKWTPGASDGASLHIDSNSAAGLRNQGAS